MSDIGIPTWVFQFQPWNSKVREPTYDLITDVGNSCDLG